MGERKRERGKERLCVRERETDGKRQIVLLELLVGGLGLTPGDRNHPYHVRSDRLMHRWGG